MPIYEYRCQSCGHELEKLQRLSDAALTQCPACGKKKLRRLVSAAGFRLKGGGWYETDFKTDNKRNLVESDGGKPATQGKSESADKPASEAGSTKPAPAAPAKEAGSSTTTSSA